MINNLGENSDIYPVLPLYNNLLHVCVETHSVNHVIKCLDLMEKQMVGKNEATYMQLLKVCEENCFFFPIVFWFLVMHLRIMGIKFTLQKLIASFSKATAWTT